MLDSTGGSEHSERPQGAQLIVAHKGVLAADNTTVLLVKSSQTQRAAGPPSPARRG